MILLNNATKKNCPKTQLGFISVVLAPFSWPIHTTDNFDSDYKTKWMIKKNVSNTVTCITIKLPLRIPYFGSVNFNFRTLKTFATVHTAIKSKEAMKRNIAFRKFDQFSSSICPIHLRMNIYYKIHRSLVRFSAHFQNTGTYWYVKSNLGLI